MIKKIFAFICGLILMSHGCEMIFDGEGRIQRKEERKLQKEKRKEEKKAKKEEEKAREKKEFSDSVDNLIDTVMFRETGCNPKIKYKPEKFLFVCFTKPLKEIDDNLEFGAHVYTNSGLKQGFDLNGEYYDGDSPYCNGYCLEDFIRYNERLRQADYNHKTQRYRYKKQYEEEVKEGQISKIVLHIFDKNNSDLKVMKTYTDF